MNDIQRIAEKNIIEKKNVIKPFINDNCTSN